MRRLLLLLLVPVIWITAAAPAEAVEPMYGDMSSFSWSIEGENSGPNGTTLRCNWSVREKRTQAAGPPVNGVYPSTVSVIGSSKCKYDTQFVQDNDDWDEADVWLVFNGSTPGGANCAVSASGSDDMAPGPWNFQTTEAAAECDFNEACLNVVVDDHNITFDRRVTFDSCKAITVPDAPPLGNEPSGTCANGTPTFYETDNKPWPNTTRWYFPFTVGFEPGAIHNTSWGFSEYFGGPYVTSSVDRSRNSGTAFQYLGWTGDQFQYEPLANGGAALSHSKSSNDPPVVGVEVKYGTRPPEATYPVGVTVPELCLWWFGDKIVDIPNTEIDEPYLPLGPSVPPQPPDTPVVDPPDGSGEDCNFSFSNPATWLEGGMCAAVGLLGAIVHLLGDAIGVLGNILGALVSGFADVVSAIAGIAADIVAGLWEFLEPNPAGWDIDGLVDQLQTRPPFSLIEPLADEATQFAGSYTSAGSCGVLADFGDAEVTCSDIQNAPGLAVLYEVARIAIVVCTGWGLFRIFSQLFEDQG